jgi:hypothetical protein
MSDEGDAEEASSPNVEPVKKFTPAERIEELNNIDKVSPTLPAKCLSTSLTLVQSISDLLKSAASAMTVLANTSTTNHIDLASQKAAFTEATESYFSKLSTIDVRLRRNVYALEEAGLVLPGDPHRDGKKGAAAANSDEARTGGNGPLDSTWLNARSSNGVSKAMAQEIWGDARRYVERLDAKSTDEQRAGAVDNMDVDAEDG